MDKLSQGQKLPVIGWREILALPDLSIAKIEAKIDTGARSSAIHAQDIKIFQQQDGKEMIRFQVRPYGKHSKETIIVETTLLDQRQVRSSNGQAQVRPVIETIVKLGNQQWPIEINLTNRDAMIFPMLLGRQALRDRFLVDAGSSFLQSKTQKKS